jgi:uncharacterized SAM-dependent methyltransferase
MSPMSFQIPNYLALKPHSTTIVVSETSEYDTGIVLDIGGSNLSKTLKTLLEEKLLQRNGQAQCLLPSALLSDDAGLQLWHQINRLPDYYQTSDEVELFAQHSSGIAESVEDNTSLVDLGCG